MAGTGIVKLLNKIEKLTHIIGLMITLHCMFINEHICRWEGRNKEQKTICHQDV